MKFVLAPLILAATVASAQTGTIGTIYGHPIQPHNPVPPQMPISRFNPQPLPIQNRNGTFRQPPTHVTFLPGFYYNPYAFAPQPETNVSVNVTNVIPQAPPQVVYVTPQPVAQPASGGGLVGYPDAWKLERRPEPRDDRPAPDPNSHAGTAEPADVNAIGSVINAFYDVLSGPSMKGRDWNRFRGLFSEGARLFATVSIAGMPARATPMTPDEYAQNIGPIVQRGVFEKEIARTVEQFGRMAQVFSTYELRYNANDPKPYQRGVNSMQLLNDGTRWWIVSVYWDAERPDNPIPAKYLPKQ